VADAEPHRRRKEQAVKDEQHMNSRFAQLSRREADLVSEALAWHSQFLESCIRDEACTALERKRWADERSLVDAIWLEINPDGVGQ
jgi:hypothetical protein